LPPFHIYCGLAVMAPSQAEFPASREADMPRRQILVVDDDLSLLDALQRALSDDPRLEVTACSTFDDARRRLREQRFDVMIADVRLGAFNGLQLVVLARDMNHATQVIVFSGYDDPVLRAEAEHLGAVYLVKPVLAGTLLNLIRAKEHT
jgi:DNA-binding NtrC family response regulator